MPFGSGYNAQIIAPPAALLAGVLLAGFILDLVWPISFVPEGYTLPVGLALIFLAVNLKAFAAREMIKIKTTLSLQRPATDLATSSVFACSRNPIYLGMVLLCGGVAVFTNSLCRRASSSNAREGLCAAPLPRLESRSASTTSLPVCSTGSRWCDLARLGHVHTGAGKTFALRRSAALEKSLRA